MATGLELALRAISGAATGVVAGALAGWIGAFLERYLQHPLAPLADARGRIGIATGNVAAFSRLAGVAGLVTGGVAGGFGNLETGLVAAAALGLITWVAFRWALDGSADFLGMAWGVIAGATAGAVAGYFSGLLVRAA